MSRNLIMWILQAKDFDISFRTCLTLRNNRKYSVKYIPEAVSQL